MGTIALPEVRAGQRVKHCERQRHVMVVCTGEHCAGHGASELLDELKQASRAGRGDLRVSAARCIGHCGAAPAVIEDGSLLRWVSLRRLRAELMRLGLL